MPGRDAYLDGLLEDMVVRLVRPPKIAGVHGYKFAFEINPVRR